MKAIIKYSTVICPFTSGKYGMEGKKLQKTVNKQSLSDEIKSIFHSF